MQASEDLLAKVQAAMGNRTISVQSFEERFPGVFIRKKKKRDMDRCLSATSMDSWVSEVESEESMSWLLGNVSPPISPSKRSQGGATPARQMERMIPVMSMDRLDEANDPVVMNDWQPNIQAVRAPSRGFAPSKTVPGATVGPLFQNSPKNPDVCVTPPDVAAGQKEDSQQQQKSAPVQPQDSADIAESSPPPLPPTLPYSAQDASSSAPPLVPTTPDYPSAPPATAPHFPTNPAPATSYSAAPAQFHQPYHQNQPRQHQTQQQPQHQQPQHQQPQHQQPRHQHSHAQQHQPHHHHHHHYHLQQHAQAAEHMHHHGYMSEGPWAGPDGNPQSHLTPQMLQQLQHHYADHMPPMGGKGNASYVSHMQPYAAQQHGKAGNRSYPEGKQYPQGKGNSTPNTFHGKGAGKGAAAPPARAGSDTASDTSAPQVDGAAAAAYMAAAAMAGKGGNKDFSFGDFFLAYMNSAKPNTDPAAAQVLMQQLAQQHQTQQKRMTQEEAEKQAVDPRKYKTRMCRNWETKGHCPYEHTCCFAHGPDELRDLTTNHKLLASIGYFSNIILLSMTNGTKPALPPHCLYQQPQMLATPETPEELKRATETLPDGVHFPFQDPMPAALRGLKKEAKSKQQQMQPQPPATQPSKEMAATSEDEAAKKRSRRRKRGKKDKGKDATDSHSDNGEDIGA